MLRSSWLIVTTLVALACSTDKAQDKHQAAPPPPPVGSAVPEQAVGSAADASGSAADGSADDTGSGAAGSAAPGSDSAGVAASGFEFDKLTHDEKVKFMKQKVMPAMKPVFQKFDPKEFAKFTCKTCHGDEPAKRKYEMPSEDLPALDFDAIKAGKEDAKMVEFMSKVVKPQMAKLLNEPEMSDTQPKGFGCLHCHTMKKK